MRIGARQADMLKITPDPRILAALTAAFPKPSSAATKALSKYIALLEQQISTALLNGRNPEQHKLGLYTVSLHHMMNRGGQIGPQKVRLHNWLNDHGLALIKKVTTGTNITGKLSEVALTTLASLVITTELDQGWQDTAAVAVDFADVLQNKALDQDTIISRLCPELSQGIDETQLLELFHVLEVDVGSLKNYMHWLKHDSKHYTAAKKEHALNQASMILAVANAVDGKYLQRKKPSEFGRVYYQGVSIQNIDRTLRSAVLGQCWEYDIRSSVVCWKMGFAKHLVRSLNSNQTVEEFFKFTLWYINDKQDLMLNLRAAVFTAQSNVPAKSQNDLLKQAFTAISFGARVMETGWKDDSGAWQNPAIVDIIKNVQERKRFLANLIVKSFIAEQNLLDAYIFEQVKTQTPELLSKPLLKTLSGKPAKAKILAYMYQHAETQVMDVVRSTAIASGYEPIANVHDAVFFRKSIGVNTLDKIVWAMRDATNNPYWALKPKEIKRFKRSKNLHEKEESEHQARITAEEALAKQRSRNRNTNSLQL